MTPPQFIQNIRIALDMLVCRVRWWSPFIRHTRDPQLIQDQLLKNLLRTQEHTPFGEKHGFQHIQGYQEYRLTVPLHTYEELRPHFKYQEEARQPYLTKDLPQMYVCTSGTTGSPKLIPILSRTREGVRQFQRLSTYSYYSSVPGMFRGKVLILAGSELEGALPSGTPFGSLSGLLAADLPWVLHQKLVLPKEIHAIPEYSRKYFHIAAWVLSEKNLSAVITPSPSALLHLLEVVREHLPEIVDRLQVAKKQSPQGDLPLPRPSSRRLKFLQSLVGKENDLTVETLWPKLRAVVTWTGGNCHFQRTELKPKLPQNVKIIELGYVSSEVFGSLNVDVRHNSCIPNFQENFFEFIELADWDANRPQTVRLNQLEVGKKYYVVVTTWNGLYRYFMNDVIRVVGQYNHTPIIRFVQKGEGVTNLVGEQLYEFQVRGAMKDIQQAYQVSIPFFMMFADPSAAQYTLYVEHEPLDFFVGYKFEQFLGNINKKFQERRDKGSLQPVKIEYVQPGTEGVYRRFCIQQGQLDAQFQVMNLQYSKNCPFDFLKYLRF